jgi:hypothetical protein
MKAKARIVNVDHISGTGKTGKPYDMHIGSFLDLDTYDKIRLSVPDAQVENIKACVGKDGMLDVGFDARTEKLSFVGFKAAA